MRTHYRRVWLIMVMRPSLAGWSVGSYVHHNPCHRRHSCPSDHQTYVCGDLGDCSQGTDNAFCLNKAPRPVTQRPAPSSRPSPGQLVIVTVQRVIDGDTLQLDTGAKVRLISVDTPETKDPRKPVQSFWKEATAFTQHLVEGKRVHLAYDQQRRDKYGWTLDYMYLDDGTFVNAEII
jgi:endonuclease YncB( thermonuclease family)